MLGVLAITAFVALSNPVSAFALLSSEQQHQETSTSTGKKTSASLSELALEKVLGDASPIFGEYFDGSSNTSTWMKAYPDHTLLTHLNLPGVHDAATWNYSQATQLALDHITDLIMDGEAPTDFYRCQNRSMVRALSAGIRVFDLRYAYDVTNSSLVFWHGPGLQSQTSTVDDVLFSFYQWLTNHPSEVVFLSFQYEGSTSRYSTNDAGVQRLLYHALTTAAAHKYIQQARGVLGTLGEARGKIVLLRRFDLDLLPASYEAALPGLHFSPTNWTDNSPNITLEYNTTSGATAYIEDYYQPLTPSGSSAEENIRWKLNATEAHLRMASTTHPDSLFWTFASSTNILNGPPITPAIQAVGNGTDTPKAGVNQQLAPFLEGFKRKRLGIVMFDFYEIPTDLVPTFLGLLPPEALS